MKLKKVMAAILAAALTFSMAACGGDTTADPTPTPTSGASQGGATNDTPSTPNTNNTTTGSNDEIIIVCEAGEVLKKPVSEVVMGELLSNDGATFEFDGPEGRITIVAYYTYYRKVD